MKSKSLLAHGININATMHELIILVYCQILIQLYYSNYKIKKTVYSSSQIKFYYFATIYCGRNFVYNLKLLCFGFTGI